MSVTLHKPVSSPTLCAAAVALVLAACTPALAAPGPVAPAFEGMRPAVEQIQYRHRGHRGRGPGWGIGAGIAGGIIAGALLAPRYYGPSYDGPYYGARTYTYDAPPPPVYDEDEGDDAVAYCMRRFRSYDPRSGTYLGYDGNRHPCP